jgi:hypothetical protein
LQDCRFEAETIVALRIWIDLAYGCLVGVVGLIVYLAYRVQRPWPKDVAFGLVMVLFAATWAFKMYEDLMFRCP